MAPLIHVCLGLAVLLLWSPLRPAHARETQRVDGLEAPAALFRDETGSVHIVADGEHDMVFAQGWAHARDRLFQMDFYRRAASGTLAELVGQDALADDIQLRTIGLRRAAVKSLAALSPKLQSALDSYAAGVNAYIAANPLPPEYAALKVTAIPPWEALESVAIGKLLVFQLAFDLDDIARTSDLATYVAVLGADKGRALFFEDMYRIAPFEPFATVPADDRAASQAASRQPERERGGRHSLSPRGAALGRAYLDQLGKTKILSKLLLAREKGQGSNAFVIGGHFAKARRPILANDPHLDLTVPSVFYPLEMRALRDRFHVVGASFPGIPYAALGFNDSIAWGATASGMDVTDIYLDQLVPIAPSGTSAGGLGILYNGKPQALDVIPQQFRVNEGGTVVNAQVPPDAGGVTLVVPRPDGGPIIKVNDDGTALSVQWAGLAATRELDAFRDMNRARSLSEFRSALAHFDAGSENFLYADRFGSIAYLLSGEMPLREDLQAAAADDTQALESLTPPFLIRNGTGGEEWLTLSAPAPDQALRYQILPPNEMPHAINPRSGLIVSANNDPNGDTFDNDALNQFRPGGGVRYLGADYNPGIRAQRIADLLQAAADERRLDINDLQRVQSDVVMPDAQVFVPYILAAFANPQAVPFVTNLDAVGEAVRRLRAWSPPDGGCEPKAQTGVEDGYDYRDKANRLQVPSLQEIRNSVATSIFSMWRSKMIANSIDATLVQLGIKGRPPGRYAIRALRHLIESDGIGVSGIDFFAFPDIGDPRTRRDIVILKSLEDALDRLTSHFGSSTQDTFRWGKLHGVRLVHPLGDAFSPIGPDGAFPPPYPDMPGVPVDGGYETIDRATHDVRAGLEDPASEFVFDFGPVQRFVAQLGPGPIRAENALPGGVSGDPDSPYFANLLGPWLANDAYRVRAAGSAGERVILVPNRGDAEDAPRSPM
jgi:penicillin G amidase